MPHGGGEEADEVPFDFVDGGVAGEVGGVVIGVGGAVLIDERDGVGRIRVRGG